MNTILQTVHDNFISYNWNGPFTLVLAILAILVLMRKWGMFLTLTTTILLGIGGANLMIMNAATAQQVVTVPIAVYTIGGTILAIVTLLAYIKFTLS